MTHLYQKLTKKTLKKLAKENARTGPVNPCASANSCVPAYRSPDGDQLPGQTWLPTCVGALYMHVGACMCAARKGGPHMTGSAAYPDQYGQAVQRFHSSYTAHVLESQALPVPS